MTTSIKTCRKCNSIFEGRYCPVCRKAINAAYRANNSEKVKAATAKWKYANPVKLKAATDKYRKNNPDKVHSACAKWRKNNPDKVIEYNKNRDRDDPVKQAKRGAKYYLNNAERVKKAAAKWNADNPEKKKDCDARWNANNKEKKRVYVQNRRSKKRENGGELSKGLPQKLFRLQRGKCPCCGKDLGKNFHLDHKMPIALNGKNVDENIQLLCAPCNLSKGAKHPIDFMQSRGFLL